MKTVDEVDFEEEVRGEEILLDGTLRSYTTYIKKFATFMKFTITDIAAYSIVWECERWYKW